MKKLLAIAMTLVLALTMTTTAFAADPKSGAAGITWQADGGPVYPPVIPPDFSAFANRDFNFGTKTMSLTENQTWPSVAPGLKAGYVVENPSTSNWIVQVRVGGFYKATDTTKAGTQYMKGFTLTLNTPNQKLGDGAAFTTDPVNSSAALSANATTGGLGTADDLAKGGFGLYGMNWEASLFVPAASEKVAEAVSAELEWNVVTAA